MKLSILIPNRLEENIEDFVKEVEDILPAAQIIVATDRYSMGKGWAVREALNEAFGDVICFLDGDRDVSPKMLLRLLPFIDAYDVVLASKTLYNAPLHRRIITHLSKIYIRLMFGIKEETQTGLKLFRRSALTSWESNNFIFDIEILAKAKKRKLKIIEIPIEVSIKKKMSLKVVYLSFLSSLQLKWRLIWEEIEMKVNG